MSVRCQSRRVPASKTTVDATLVKAVMRDVLRAYATPIRLRVTSGIKAGGIETHNHNRALLGVWA